MNKQELIEKVNGLDELQLNQHYLTFLIGQLDEPEKVKVPKFVADWYEINKDNLDKNIACLFLNWERTINDNDFFKWMSDADDFIQTLVNMHQFGYEVEKEKRYFLKFKGVNSCSRYLKQNTASGDWYMGTYGTSVNVKVYHTRKELEEAGFGWVFDCEGIEVEEVK